MKAKHVTSFLDSKQHGSADSYKKCCTFILLTSEVLLYKSFWSSHHSIKPPENTIVLCQIVGKYFLFLSKNLVNWKVDLRGDELTVFTSTAWCLWGHSGAKSLPAVNIQRFCGFLTQQWGSNRQAVPLRLDLPEGCHIAKDQGKRVGSMATTSATLYFVVVLHCCYLAKPLMLHFSVLAGEEGKKKNCAASCQWLKKALLYCDRSWCPRGWQMSLRCTATSAALFFSSLSLFFIPTTFGSASSHLFPRRFYRCLCWAAGRIPALYCNLLT